MRFDERIEPILHRFRQEGGSVADLKSRLAEDAAAFRPQLEAIVTTQLAKVLTGVFGESVDDRVRFVESGAVLVGGWVS